MNQPPLSPYDLDVTPAPMPAVLTPAQRSAIHEATQRAYHQARANGADVETAQAIATQAAIAAGMGDVIGEADGTVTYLSPEQPADLPIAQSHAESEEAGVDAVGLARSEADKLAAERAGFAPAPTVYTRGLRVIQAGVEAAEASRADFDRKPKVAEACETFRGRIAKEQRRDVATNVVGIAMRDDGTIHDLDTPFGFAGRLEQGAFENLVSRLGYGGGRYLADKCTPELRAVNVNAQRDRLDDEQEAERVRAAEAAAEQKTANKWAPRQVVLRTRRDRAAKEPTARSTFAVVSPTYAPFDCDLVAEAIAQATPPEARGSIAYDGRRTRFEILFQSTVAPKHFVAGEFFRAGVVVRTDDTGGGSVRGSSVVWQNLCLNLAIIDRCAQDLFSMHHTGTVAELARKFRAHFAKALGAIDHFVTAWGYACEDDVTEGARLVSGVPLPSAPEELVAGIFRGLLVGGARAKWKLPGGAAIEPKIEKLVEAWRKDESSARAVHAVSRAAIVNAATRYAHEVAATMDDPFAEDEITRQACAILWAAGRAKAPKALEYVELQVDGSEATVSA